MRNPGSRLSGRVDLEIRRLSPGRWEEVVEDTVVISGDRLSFRIVNRHEDTVYVNLLDLGLTGQVDLLYPAPGAQAAVAPQGSVEVGIRAGEEINVYMPSVLPFDPRQSSAAGREVLKLIVSTQPIDLWMLLQDGVRRGGGEGGGGEVGKILAEAVRGREVRAHAPLGEVPEDWTTVERSFILRSEA